MANPVLASFSHRSGTDVVAFSFIMMVIIIVISMNISSRCRHGSWAFRRECPLTHGSLRKFLLSSCRKYHGINLAKVFQT